MRRQSDRTGNACTPDGSAPGADHRSGHKCHHVCGGAGDWAVHRIGRARCRFRRHVRRCLRLRAEPLRARPERSVEGRRGSRQRHLHSCLRPDRAGRDRPSHRQRRAAAVRSDARHGHRCAGRQSLLFPPALALPQSGHQHVEHVRVLAERHRRERCGGAGGRCSRIPKIALARHSRRRPDRIRLSSLGRTRPTRHVAPVLGSPRSGLVRQVVVR